MHMVKLCKKCVKKKTPHKQIQECSDALNKSTDIIQELVSAHEGPSFGPGADALPYEEGTIPSQGNKNNIEINIDRHIAKQKNEELHYKARYKKLLEVITKPHAREWPLKRSPHETITRIDDEGLGHNHRTQEWNSETVQDVTTVKGYHQDKKENNTNTEPLEGLAEETIVNKAPDEQVDRQWDECLKEGWWKSAKIAVIGERMWKIITEPRHKLSVAKHNILKVIKAPKKDHRRVVAQEHPEKYPKEDINWNDAHHSQLIWQLAALRTNVQTLPIVIIVNNPARGYNPVTTDCNHTKAVVLLPYEALIKAPEIAMFAEERTLSLSNDSKRAIADKDTCFALSPYKKPCKQPTEGQVTPSRHQWTNRWFRNSNRLMELMFAALNGSKSDKGTNWLLLV
jgi:hypothetical protein